MKSKKTKKILGGVAIAAVSLGCLGLAGIANAADTTTTGTTSSSSTGSAPASGAYQLGPMTGAMTGTTTITANISAAQVESGEKLSDHSLEYIQIGSYMTHGSSGSFTVSASTQKVEDALYNFLTTSTGGLKQAFPNSDYSTSDGEAFNWLLTGNSGTFLGHDASGQGNYGTPDEPDYAVRLLANYLYSNVSSLGTLTDAKLASVSTTNGTQAGSFTVNNPGVYLIIDNVSSNASLPIILSTMPTKGYTIPQGMANWVTDQIALKDQDPQAMPVKQFVTGTSVDKSGDLTGGTLSTDVTSSVGAQNTVTYQVSNVFPNTNGYQSYTYKFIDYPGQGMTLNIAGGANMYVAGIPLATLVSNGDATVTTFSDNASQTYGNGGEALSKMNNLDGAAGDASSLTVSLDEAGMQYIAQNGYQTSNVAGKAINFSKLFNTTLPSSKSAYQPSVSNTVNGTGDTSTTNNMQGAGNGASSYTGQTQKAASGENGNSTTVTNTDKTTGKTTTYASPQAQGELFGLTYEASLNTSLQTKMINSAPVTEASNTAETVNNGVQSGKSGNMPLPTSGKYNGGTKDESGTTSGTQQINPGDTTGSINGIPGIHAVGAGINWMKIWGSGSVAPNAEFQVQNSKGEYLYATGNGWGWTSEKSQAETFSPTSLYGSSSSSSAGTGSTGTGTTGTAGSTNTGNGTTAGASGTGSMGSSSSAVNPAAEKGFFEITGLADGTYTVTETKPATGADPNVFPSFQVTVSSTSPEKIITTSASDNLVDNTPNGNPFNSTEYNTVENVKSVTGLPLTGGAGILTGVIAAVLLFGTAGIVLVVYKRRKAQREE